MFNAAEDRDSMLTYGNGIPLNEHIIRGSGLLDE